MFIDCPSAPSGRPKISKVTPTSCHLDWDAPTDDGGSPVTSYIVEKLICASESQNGDEQWQTVGPSYVRHTIVWDLVGGQQYKFRVAAENMLGRSIMGDESEVVIASGSPDQDTSSEMNYDSLGLYLIESSSSSVTSHTRPF